MGEVVEDTVLGDFDLRRLWPSVGSPLAMATRRHLRKSRHVAGAATKCDLLLASGMEKLVAERFQIRVANGRRTCPERSRRVNIDVDATEVGLLDVDDP